MWMLFLVIFFTSSGSRLGLKRVDRPTFDKLLAMSVTKQVSDIHLGGRLFRINGSLVEVKSPNSPPRTRSVHPRAPQHRHHRRKFEDCDTVRERGRGPFPGNIFKQRDLCYRAARHTTRSELCGPHPARSRPSPASGAVWCCDRRHRMGKVTALAARSSTSTARAAPYHHRRGPTILNTIARSSPARWKTQAFRPRCATLRRVPTSIMIGGCATM